MSERWIFFSDGGIDTIGDDSKTQTRRPIRQFPRARGDVMVRDDGRWAWVDHDPNSGLEPRSVRCCYGAVGDVLGCIRSTSTTRFLSKYLPYLWELMWHSFVAHWVVITELRAESLVRIRIEDIDAEGFGKVNRPGRVHAFWHTWDRFYKEQGFGVSQEPWVWVITFSRMP